ncbi:MAG: AbrB/MazE/SpoVT family DNA-binding domain-containing protein [Oscillospiraceae bacterium]
MKETGVTRALDSLGRVVIPIEIRRRFEINEDEELEFYIEDDKIIMKKFIDSCTFCGSRDNLTEYKGKHICTDCIKDVKTFKA